jgi:uncharacterized coiled-coil protein SlyX
MARRNMSVARVEKLSAANVGKAERHNERKNESYANLNVVPERIPFNVSFKSTDGLTYNEYFDKLLADGEISTRGLKEGATLFDELIVDVNTEYFEAHGGYEFAREFYEEAYRYCCRLYGENNIVSAVMHADEINKEVSERLGRPVYHYHLHVVAIPTVEKEILWSKRCKDEALRGTVKEVIRQVSHSKKWKNTVPMLDENGEPVLNKSGKPVFVKSYSILQDELFDHMRAAGFLDVERGTRGSTAEHLTSLDYQVQQDEARLENIQATITKQEDKLSTAEAKLSETKIAYKKNEAIAKTYNEIDTMGKKGLGGKYAVSKEDYVCLTSLAKEGIASRGEIGRLNDTIGYCNRRISSLSSAVNRLEAKLDEMTEKYRRLVEITKPYLLALDQFPEKVRDFFDRLFPPKQKEPERELPEPKPKARHRDDRER